MNKYLITFSGSVIVGVSIYIFLFYSRFEEVPSHEHIWGYGAATLAALTGGYLFLQVNGWLDEVFPWKKSFSLRFFTGLIISFVNFMSVTGLFFYLFMGANLGGTDGLFGAYGSEFIKMLILLFFSLVVFESAYFMFFSYHQYAVVQAASVEEGRRQKNLQFEALKSQLSPHFLFNSLNTISSLVYKDTSAAEEFVRRLAVTYQYVIETDKEMLVSLENEVEFIRSYYHLLKVRFEDALNIDINLPNNLMQSVIPPLTLQILIENAVKHNTVDKDNPLEIVINGEDNSYLRVSNTKGNTPSNVKSFKVGLENIKRRYAFYTPRGIKIENDTMFTVHLPVIENLEVQSA